MKHPMLTPMDRALLDVRKGRMSQTKAAKKHDVPRSTLSILCRVLRVPKSEHSRAGRPKKKGGRK